MVTTRLNLINGCPCLNTAQIEMILEINGSASGHMSRYTGLLIKGLIDYHWINGINLD